MTTEIVKANGFIEATFQRIRSDHENTLRCLEGYCFPDPAVEEHAAMIFQMYPDLRRTWAAFAKALGEGAASILAGLIVKQHVAAVGVLMTLARELKLEATAFYAGGRLCRELVDTRPDIFDLVANGWPNLSEHCGFPESIVSQRCELSNYECSVLDRCGAELQQLLSLYQRAATQQVPADSRLLTDGTQPKITTTGTQTGEQISVEARAAAIFMSHSEKTGKLMTWPVLAKLVGVSKSTLAKMPLVIAARKGVKVILRQQQMGRVHRGYVTEDGEVEAISEDTASDLD